MEERGRRGNIVVLGGTGNSGSDGVGGHSYAYWTIEARYWSKGVLSIALKLETSTTSTRSNFSTHLF